MGLTAERMHRKYGVSREDSDAFSLRSHQNAAHAQAHGHFVDEIVPVEVECVSPGYVTRSVFDRDEGPRADTIARSARQAEARLPRARHRDRGQPSQTR